MKTLGRGMTRLATAPNLATPGRAHLGSQLSFFLFLLVVTILFVRPTDLVPSLENVPIYEWVILASLISTASTFLNQWLPKSLIRQPITLCVLGLLSAVVLSHLSHLRITDAYESGFIFFKAVVLYLLLVGNVNTMRRLRFLLSWMGMLILVTTILAILQYHEVINIESMAAFQQKQFNAATGETEIVLRLCGTGIFNDPNDLSIILSVGVVIACYWIGERKLGPARFLLVVPLLVFLYAITLTQSRGGFLALLAGGLILLRELLGTRRAILVAALSLPVLFVLFGGRQMQFNLADKDDTSQYRIRLWSDALMAQRSAPIFGIGEGTFVERARQVAHNSFLQAYAEMGFYGGTFFLGAFTYAFWRLRGLRLQESQMTSTAGRARPYLIAIEVVLAAGCMSLTRLVTPTTYLILGLATAYLNSVSFERRRLASQLRSRHVIWLIAISIAFLIATQVFVLLVVQWS